MSERMTRERIQRKERRTREERERAAADAEPVMAFGSEKPRRQEYVVPEDHQNDECGIEKVAMNVLEDEREFRLAPIADGLRFTDRARDRVGEE